MSNGKDKIQEIIENSGNDLQFQIAEYLSNHKWEVLRSPYYNDPVTSKSREIDIVATRKWPMNRLGELVIRLFIECKHIKTPVIFWFTQKNMSSAIELAKDNSILDNKPNYYLNQASPQHHYVDNAQVAKIAAKSGNRDDIFEAMNQCLNSLIFFKNSGDIASPYCINFPIIVTDSFQNLHKRDQNNGHVSIVEPFQLEVDYSYKQSQRNGNPVDVMKYFLIDIVGFDKLDSFLQDLENRDIKLLRENLSWDLEYQEGENRKQSERNRLDPYD